MNFYIDNGLISYDEVISAFQKGHIEKNDLRQYFLDTLPNSRSEYVHDKINSVIEDINEGRFPVCYKVKPEMVGCVLGNISKEELAKAMLTENFARYSDISDIDLNFISIANFDKKTDNDVVWLHSVIASDDVGKTVEFPINMYIPMADVTPTFSYSVPEICKEDHYMPLGKNIQMEGVSPIEEIFKKENTEKFLNIKDKFENIITTLNEDFEIVPYFKEVKNEIIMELRDYIVLPEVYTQVEFNTTSITPFSDFMDVLKISLDNAEKFPNKADEIILICDAIREYSDSFESNSLSNEYSFVNVSHKLELNYITFHTEKSEKIPILEGRSSLYVDYNELKSLYENKLKTDVTHNIAEKDI